VQNEIEGSQSRQRSTNGFEETFSQRRSAEDGWGKDCEMHLGDPEGVEELPSWAKESA
jgi:hypothetical protein